MAQGRRPSRERPRGPDGGRPPGSGGRATRIDSPLVRSPAMAWYIRTLSSTDSVPYARLEDAIEQARVTIKLHGKQIKRTADGKVELHEPDGSLFNVIWIEDEGERVMRF
jgi:hypothetical protein